MLWIGAISATPPTCVPSVLYGEYIFTMQHKCGAAASGDDEKKIVRLERPNRAFVWKPHSLGAFAQVRTISHTSKNIAIKL